MEADVLPVGGQWPLLRQTAGELGIRRAVAAELLVGGGVPAGAMDIYHSVPVPLGARDRAQFAQFKAYTRVFALWSWTPHPY
ncbi:hypothetical protein ACIOKD_40465 [Streptomyces sp. NPDC087844]|uniref:hypothetical protein n=1 Tax=Streptomyces sp. NPDC087844 TaxID=3365805 RepID=UPI003804CB61